MPEYPDVELYRERLADRVIGAPLLALRLNGPFLLRTADPPPEHLVGRPVRAVERLAKQLVLAFEPDGFAVLHLMIAGRLHWKAQGAPLGGRNALAAFDFPDGSLVLTEAGTKRRAALHLFRDRAGLAARDPGGIDPLACGADTFAAALQRERHTLKRALTDQRIVTGIGNAYSDEILFHAGLSPFQRTDTLSREALEALHGVVVRVLRDWFERLAREAGDGFPAKVTAFRPVMAVHGRYREPCPGCGAPVQRIRFAENEANYCARCQTGGRVLADRSLSRLLKENWPKRIEELEG